MGIFRIGISRRIQKNSKFLNSPTQIFWNAIFSKMRRQKYFFDFRFGISVKFRVEWCIRLYVSYRICPRFPANSYLRRREYVRNMGNIRKSNMNHIVLHIIRRGILRWFRFRSQKNISAYAFKRKSRLKKFAWADLKNFHRFESGVKFWFEIYPYVIKLKVTTSRIADGQKIEYVRYL